MTQRDEVQKLQGRIEVLQQERLHIQKKTFTKWMNSFLQKAKMEVDDLFVDLADGRKLLKLLEIISGEKLAKPNAGRMRVHKIENVNKSLAFLHTKVRLESIGAEDIVDGNPRLILGLIWTIILRFQIQEIEIDVDEDNESSEKTSAKDALLLWAQRRTHGYQNVAIRDFSPSWRDGLGFLALIHRHRPDLVDYDSRLGGKPLDNLNHAFDVANNELGIPRLLDAEDIDTSRPDEKSIMTYVASYYHTFARMKNEEKSGRRIAKIIGEMIETDKMKDHYDRLVTNLLTWITSTIRYLDGRSEFPNSLEGIQALLSNFGQYRNQEKPPKYKERSEIEALYFNISTRLKELRQPAFVPVEGKIVQDIERAWERLERSEHSREVALRSELRRQERLEQINYNFERKSVLRENYLREMHTVLADPRYGSNLAQVDATVKKHEAISADILARETRMHDLTNMCEELVKENYRGLERVQQRENEILTAWRNLLATLDRHKTSLTRLGAVMSTLRDIDTTLASVEQLQGQVGSVDTGPGHLHAVEALLQRHTLHELQVNALAETQAKLRRQGEQQAEKNPREEQLLRGKVQELDDALARLKATSAKRKSLLEEARNFCQFLQDQEEEEAWLVEKQRICQAGIMAKDLRGVLSLQQKHKLLLDEIKARKNRLDQLGSVGNRLIDSDHPRTPELRHHLLANQKQWALLDQLASGRTKQLQDGAETYQFYADANEADSFLHEKAAILASRDYGSDEPSAQALLQRNKDLMGELKAYGGDVDGLNSQAERLKAAGISNLDLMKDNDVPDEVREETVYETKLVPVETWEEEPVEKTEYRLVTAERIIPQVRALYAFQDSDHGVTMAKREVMVLLSKANADWWCVRKSDGSSGFVPANYVQEIEPLTLQTQDRKPEKVTVMQKVKKTKMVQQKVPVKKTVVVKPTKPARKHDDSTSVPIRQAKINSEYAKCQEVATKRHALLEDSIRLFGFYRECDDFERWIKDKEKLLSAEDPNENVDQARLKYEKFVSDISANNKRVENIDKEVKEFEKQNHSQIDKVRARHRQISKLWANLTSLLSLKSHTISGLSTIALFHRQCAEAIDWMTEKGQQLDAAAQASPVTSVQLPQDLRTVQALQRRHEGLERELAPVEEKVGRVKSLGDGVKREFPKERGSVDKGVEEVQKLWQAVKDKALERRTRLEDAVGQQIFRNSSKELLNWVADVKEQLNAENTVRDVQTAELLVKAHGDLLRQDIMAHDDEFKQVTDLGKKLLAKDPSLDEVREGVERLAEEQAALNRGWTEKNKWLQQCLELQRFNKQADIIDAATNGHVAFLEFNDLGTSLDDVEAYLKQQRAFVNTLDAQDDRLADFNKQADALIADDHYDSPAVEERRNQVVKKRAAVKEQAAARSAALDASKNYQQFCAASQDLKDWLKEKLKTASDECYRDLTNLERKLQKHEAFERELRANEGQLRSVTQLGQALIAQRSYKTPEVTSTLSELNDEWKKLVGLCLDKGRRLRQAMNQHNHNTDCDELKSKLEDISKDLASENKGSDLRSCREMQKKHEMLENELDACKQRTNDLLLTSADMRDDGHFDHASVRAAAEREAARLAALDAPMAARKAALAEAMQYYKFAFNIDLEMGWIKEHMVPASSDSVGANLHQAQSLWKKHKKLVEEVDGHESVIDKVLKIGSDLIEANDPRKSEVKELCSDLRTAMSDLKLKCAERTQKLEQSLKAQQFFFDANEVESWLNERRDVLASTDYGRDRDNATKLLTKHKAIELELDTYHSIISEMRHAANALTSTNHPESKAILERQSTLEHLVRSLQRRAAIRQRCLMESLFRHEYFAESAELERWIGEQEGYAKSGDYGQDYEHLQILQAKFDDFKRRIDAGSERWRQCENLAQKLINNDSPYTSDITQNQQQLDDDKEHSEAYEEVVVLHEKMKAKYDDLRTLIANREDRLHAAGEIHRFHRDVSEALSRIHEKSAALGTELGRDLNTALSLLRRQETFENELVVLEAQLQVLVDDALRLGNSYPTNKAQLLQKQELVVTAWHGLKERADLRRDQLQASVDLQKFLTQVRDLTSWASGLRAAMNAEETVRSVARAQLLKDEHEALKGEIEARESNFQAAIDMSDAMQQTGHYAADEASQRCDALFEERSKLHLAWNNKNLHLAQLIDLHMFLREAKQIENTCNTQEAALGNNDFGTSVDEVKAHIRKHEAFEKLFTSQDERLDALLVTGDKLISQKHFEASQIASKLADIQSKRIKIKKLCAQRRHKLEDALLFGAFMRDVADTHTFIQDRHKALLTLHPPQTTSATSNTTATLEDKIRTLKKHQAFQAEISANEGRVREIETAGDSLLKKRHSASGEISKKLHDIREAWAKLLDEVALRGRGLEEAQDILELDNQLDEIEAWIRDKEVMIQAADTGRDFEHCLELTRKLDDVDSDMRVDDARIKTINALSEKLLKQSPTSPSTGEIVAAVRSRRNHFNTKWHALQGSLSDYRSRLSGALEVHAFERDVADTCSRMAEKRAGMETEDIGRDLAAVELLQRKQDALVLELSAVEDKLHNHDHVAKILLKKHPESDAVIKKRIEDLHMQWEELLLAKDKRRDALQDNYTRQKFLQEAEEMALWSGDLTKRMLGADRTECRSLAEAEAQLELHAERKAEIDGRQHIFSDLIAFGKTLLAQRGDDPEIRDGIHKLEELQGGILDAWNEHKKALEKDVQIQGFQEQIDQVVTHLDHRHTQLSSTHTTDLLVDTSTSPRALSLLLRKHTDTVHLLQQQLLPRVDELQGIYGCSNILSDSDAISKRMDGLQERKEQLLNLAKERGKRLEESRDLHGFIRRVHDVEAWVGERATIAADENYRDPTNLQAKLQHHLTFDAELHANSQRVHDIIADGQALISDHHFAKEEIKQRIDDLLQDWTHLQDLSQQKKERLNDAYQALLFNRGLDEFEAWLREIEAQVQSIDYGHSLPSTTNLLKKHTALEQSIHQHHDTCTQLNDTLDHFIRTEHFMADELKEQAQDVITRYAQLSEPMQTRRDELEASCMLHQFERDVEDEMEWLREREAIVKGEIVDGDNVGVVQSLLKKQATLDTELHSHSSIISTLSTRASHLRLPTSHSSSNGPTPTALAAELTALLASTRDAAALRKLILQDALDAHAYRAEAAECEAWIAERRPQLESGEVGRDEDGVVALQRKLEGVKVEVEAYQATIEKLTTTASLLIGRNHPATPLITQTQQSISQQFDQLQSLLVLREDRLNSALEYFRFARECTDVQEWLAEETVKAASEDYGTDVEHVELLAQAFESWCVGGLNGGEPRVTNVISLGKNLIDANNTHSAEIRTKVNELQEQWRDLLELAHARKEALAGAKQVHLFDRSADETIAWIQEKDAALAMDLYDMMDLESIQALLRNHLAYESELQAVKEQVNVVDGEATALIQTFPDTEEHINVKREDVFAAFDDLHHKSRQRLENLRQAEHLQTYFDDYQDLLAFITESLATITAPDLPSDVINAELLIDRHKEHNLEIDSRQPAFDAFFTTGDQLIAAGHSMSQGIQARVRNLRVRLEQLRVTWENRANIYERNLDVQLFKREAGQLDNWLQVREGALRDGKTGESIVQVEEMIRKHDDFEKTIAAQEEKFLALKRKTMVEEAFAQQLELEAKARQADRERLEQERQEARKRQEMQRITDQRKQEEYHSNRDRDRNNQDRRTHGKQEGENQEQRVNGNNTLYPPQINFPDEEQTTPTSTLTKSNSVAYMFGNRRRPSDVSIKRAESMKVPGMTKPVKRTPSFNTRRRSEFKPKEGDLPPVELQSLLDRKQVTMAGGKKATSRGWKTMYTVLCGQLLCFFKHKEDFAASKAVCAPVGIHNAQCAVAGDYSKRKHTFRLITVDQSEFLFQAASDEELHLWVNKIMFKAALPPSQQLLHFAVPKEQEIDLSSQSSRTSSPDVPDSIVYRQDPQIQNGNSQHYYGPRHTFSPGESPPPLPQSLPPQPPNNSAMGAPRAPAANSNLRGRAYNSLDRSDEPITHRATTDWTSSSGHHNTSPPGRPASLQTSLPPDQRKSSRIMDLFRNRKRRDQTHT